MKYGVRKLHVKDEKLLETHAKLSEEDRLSRWDEALTRVRYGSELTSELGYGLSEQDLSDLAKLYMRGWHRTTIEELLTDCNFHTECSDFCKGDCEKYIV